MRRYLIIAACSVALITIAQDVTKLQDVVPDENYENIWVKKIADDEHQTSFVIWIKKDVQLHKHEHHTENIFILGGKGKMRINDEIFVIKKGDYFNIPQNTPHGLKVLSSSPVKVLSIQSPKFEGKDRIFLEE